MDRPNLNIMDIYPEHLQDMYALCESILQDYGYTENDFFQYFDQDLDEYGLQNLTDRLVLIMFRITEDLIKQKDPKVDVDYYINGTLDTHFYINGEQQ